MDPEEHLKGVLPPNMMARGEITIDALLEPIKDVLNRRGFPDNSLTNTVICEFAPSGAWMLVVENETNGGSSLSSIEIV